MQTVEINDCISHLLHNVPESELRETYGNAPVSYAQEFIARDHLTPEMFPAIPFKRFAVANHTPTITTISNYKTLCANVIYSSSNSSSMICNCEICKPFQKYVWGICKVAGKVVSYDTLWRKVKKSEWFTQFNNYQWKSLLILSLEAIRKSNDEKYDGEFRIEGEFYSLLSLLYLGHELTIANNLVEKLTWFICNRNGYVSRDTLFKQVSGDQNIKFRLLKELLQYDWFRVSDAPVHTHNLSDKDGNRIGYVPTQYTFGSNHLYGVQKDAVNTYSDSFVAAYRKGIK